MKQQQSKANGAARAQKQQQPQQPQKAHKQPVKGAAPTKQRPASATAAAPGAAAAAAGGLLSQLRSSDAAFAALLGPSVTPREFFTEHWEEKPLHISRPDARSYYSGLFSKAIFDAHLRKHAPELKYGFNLNVCVCSPDGRKVDMNPRAQSPDSEDDEEGGDQDDEEEESEGEAEPAPKSKGKAGGKSKGAATSSSSSEGSDGEVETMTIAQALKLAESQRAKLKPSVTDDADDDEEEEEPEAEDGEEGDDSDAMDDVEALLGGGGGGSSDDDEEGEEQMDGTSVATIREYAPVTFADYDRLWKDGCTVQALQPQHYSHPMWLLLSQLEEYFGGLVGANCYLTPPNSQGLAPHYDDVEVFVLQLEGTKSWKLYHPVQNLPREHSGDFDRDELDEPFQELNLQPGDLMYLPRGVIHEARTSNTMSSHMTISVYQKTAHHDFLSALFPMALKQAFESDETDAFRRGLPLQYLSYMGSKDEMERQMEEEAPDALGISKEEAVAASHRYKPMRSSALLGQSRAALQAAFKSKIDSLLDTLKPIMLDQLDACADVLSADFMLSRLPPAPATAAAAASPSPAAAAASSKKQSGLSSQFPEELGFPPVLPGAAIRLLHPSAVRMVVVPPEDSDDEDEDGDDGSDGSDSDDSNGGHIILTHSLHNQREHHLDGRFPPSISESTIQLPLYYAPALLQLINAPRSVFTPVASLKLEFGSMVDEDGNEPDEQSKRDTQLELANTLWLSKLVQTQIPPEKPSAGADKAVKGLKRKAPDASASSAAAAASPLAKKKKQQPTSSSPAAAPAAASNKQKKAKLASR